MEASLAGRGLRRRLDPHPRVTAAAKRRQPPRRLPSPATERARDLKKEGGCPTTKRGGIFRDLSQNRDSHLRARLRRVAGGPYGASRPLRTGLACFPGIRLKPFKGVSDDTRSCDSGPKAVELPVAIGMEQDEVVEPVTATMHAPDDVVGVPPGLDADGLLAVRTSAFLSSP